MKTRTFVSILILVLAVMVIAGSCATMKSPDNLTYERFCGTWANDNYSGKLIFIGAKIIFNPDGTFVGYNTILETGTAGTTNYGNYIVEKRWIDSEGHSWYNMKVDWWVEGFGPLYILCKLNKGNSVFEGVLSSIDFPTEIDPKDKHTDYYIYYRY